MIKTFVIFWTFFLSASLIWAEQVSNANNKLAELENRFLLAGKNYDCILQAQASMYNWSIMALVGLAGLLVAAIAYINFKYAGKQIKDELQKNRKLLADTMKSITNELTVANEKKLSILEKSHDMRFSYLEASIYNAIARIYEDTLPEVSAMWYARGLKKYIDANSSPDDWIRQQITNVTDELKKETKYMHLTAENISELNEMSSKIDSGKFDKEKKDFEQALNNRIEGKFTKG